MRHLLSDQIADFSAIYQEDIELVSVSRPQSQVLEDLSNQLFKSRVVLESQWQQPVTATQSTYRELQPAIQEPAALSALTEEITLAAEVLSELVGCTEIGIRVATLNSPMCPRFHVDFVHCRMLMTVSGPGTEWIASNDVDEVLLADRDTDAVPLQAGKEVKQLPSLSLSLLKGGKWQEDFCGVVHRSPHQRHNRLLLSLDPIFS